MGKWYTSLKQPPFNPPNWVFPVVWALVYTLMGIASVKIYKAGGGFFTRVNSIALGMYLAQLALNVIWNPAFFLSESTEVGLSLILTIDVMVILTTWKFFEVDRTAGYLMIPYVTWSLFATLLSYSIWLLNLDSSNVVTPATDSSSPLRRENSSAGYNTVP